MNKIFPKIRFEIREEVLHAIQNFARFSLDIYTPDVSEDQQCGGYYAFKMLCLQAEPLPATHKFPEGYSVTGGPGMYLLSRLHPMIRERALICAKELRKNYKIYDK